MNLLTIAFYELKRILRNHRLVLLVLSQPIVIAIIVGLIVFQDPKNINLGIVNNNKNEFSNQLEDKLKNNENFIIKNYSMVDDNEIKKGTLRGFIVININDTKPISGKVEVLNDPTGRSVKYIVLGEVSKAVTEVTKEIAIKNVNDDLLKQISELSVPTELAPLFNTKIDLKSNLVDPIEFNDRDLTPFSLKSFDYFASAMMVLMIILAILNISSISITGERATGTFERLFVTPYSKIDVIFGKAIAYFLIGIIITILGTASLYLIFSISIGSLAMVALINLLVVATAVTLGLLVSSVTYTVVESAELAMYLFFISVLTTSIFTPIETANKYMAEVIRFVPFYYAVDASRRVNMADAHWENITINIYILIGTFLFFLLLSIVLLRREAK